MNAQDLKNSILQLAIKGKLVEQREEEGTAEELYRKVQREKQRLIEEEKIKNRKKLPEIAEDEIPFEIPDNWKWIRLNDVGITQTGNTPPRKHPENFGDYIPFISPADILNGQINYENNGLSEEGMQKGRVISKNSILQVCIGGSIGKCAINLHKVSYNQQINAIHPILNDYVFIYHVLDSDFFNNAIKSHSTGTATPIINKGAWEKLIIPLPPLKEQKRIVSKVQELIPLIERYGDAYTEVKELNEKFPVEMEKSILQYAIKGKLVEQRDEEGTAEELYKQIQEEKQRLIEEGKIKKQKKLPEITEEEIPFEIPDSWELVRLGDIIELISGQDMPSSMYNEKEKGIPYITGASNIKESKVIINRWIESPRSVALEGDLLLTCKGTVGETAILCEKKVHIARQLMAIRPILCDVNYLEFFINSYINKLKKKAKSMIPGINRKDVLEIIIPLPPLQEQNRIVNGIEEIFPYNKQLMKK
ncbi:Type I site-specific deoxyribonuclease [Lentibacillus sp. JNUCC-1]|uniref:restriction endonuclease subunit S n=1 Tax=Lentibacillus sp. JNUCC-1 TaxID=2654513 RepID=UPI0012E8F8C0|nr:restriction endonuclease subunit S [Lentibacillus sp. JNUCC-1]MUV38775.1 Type I site-specific deoxyribonuclease [Lentibacillus sp. JNUCC-1]